MTIVRWTSKPTGRTQPFSEWDRLRSQMLGLFDHVHRQVEGGSARAGVFPLINIEEDEDNLIVTAELPGVPAEHLELSFEKDNLIMRGERKIPEAGKEVNYHRREREAGFFRRVINLPVRVDADKVTARCKNGVLEVVLPKAGEAKTRRIDVASA